MKRFFENKSVNRLAQALKRNGRFDEAVWIALSVEIQILSLLVASGELECRYNGFEILSMNRLDRKSRWISAGTGYLQGKKAGSQRKPPNDRTE
jgi:hypothetical protein